MFLVFENASNKTLIINTDKIIYIKPIDEGEMKSCIIFTDGEILNLNVSIDTLAQKIKNTEGKKLLG